MPDPNYDDEFDKLMGGGSVPATGDDEFDRLMAGGSAKAEKGPLEREWEAKHGASLDATSAEAMKLLTDPATFAKSLGGTAARYGLGAATAGPGLMSMLSTILTGSGTGGLGAATKGGEGLLAGVKGAKGALASTGIDAANQGAQGAVAAAADSLNQGDDQKTMLRRILDAAGPGALAELGASIFGGAGDAIGGGLEWAAKKAKNVVAGSNTAEASALLDKLGPTADTDMFGKLLDKYSPTGLFSPKSAAGHLETSVAPQAQVQGQRVGQMIDKAGYDEGVNDLVPDAFRKFQGNVDDRALEAMRRPAGGEARDFAVAMANEADEVRKMSTPDDLAEFVRDKSGFQSSGAQKGAVGYAETARAKANQAVGGIGKDAIDELMQNASPETYARWDNARGQKSELEMLKSVLSAKKAAETTAGDIGSTIGSGVVGAGLGALAGAGSDNTLEGAAGGAGLALAGAFGLTGGATKTAIRQLGGTGLADFGANVARSGGNLARGIGDFADALPTGGISADVGNVEASKGYQTNQLVDEALKQNPRMFGKYAYLAKMSDEERKQELSRLQDDDPQFRVLLKNLNSAAASMGR